MLSVQKKDWVTGRLISFFDIFSSFVTRTVADNPILGIVTVLIGANLDLPITNEHLTLPEVSSVLRYVTAP